MHTFSLYNKELFTMIDLKLKLQFIYMYIIILYMMVLYQYEYGTFTKRYKIIYFLL